jgi:hypothetical protein
MELQVALCKLQLLAQKWSIKSNRNISSSLSWHSALQLAYTEINSAIHNNNENRVSLILIRIFSLQKHFHGYHRYTVRICISLRFYYNWFSICFQLNNVLGTSLVYW